MTLQQPFGALKDVLKAAEEASPDGLRCRAHWLRETNAIDDGGSTARHLELAADLIEACVLQEWMVKLSKKKQTVALGALRSPDTVFTLNLKKVTVWQRCHMLKNADPMTGYMHAALQELPLFEQIDREFERLPLHSAHHILLTMQVIAYDHPDPDVRQNAGKFYGDAVDAQHLNPETRAQYEARYTDNASRATSSTS